MKPRKGIRRVVYEGSHIKGWSATITRASGHAARLFSDGVHGGKLAAYRAASAWYEQMLPHFPLATRLGRMVTVRRNNRSGVAGVYRWPATGENRDGAYWGAQWVVDAGARPVRRKYSIACYGERQAKKLAIKARDAALETLR